MTLHLVKVYLNKQKPNKLDLINNFEAEIVTYGCVKEIYEQLGYPALICFPYLRILKQALALKHREWGFISSPYKP